MGLFEQMISNCLKHPVSWFCVIEIWKQKKKTKDNEVLNMLANKLKLLGVYSGLSLYWLEKLKIDTYYFSDVHGLNELI